MGLNEVFKMCDCPKCNKNVKLCYQIGEIFLGLEKLKKLFFLAFFDQERPLLLLKKKCRFGLHAVALLSYHNFAPIGGDLFVDATIDFSALGRCPRTIMNMNVFHKIVSH